MVSAKKNAILLLIIALIAPLLIGFLWSNSLPENNQRKERSNTSSIELSQDNNLSIDVKTSFPKLIWIEGQLIIKITSNVAGDAVIQFTDSNNGNYFVGQKNEIELLGSDYTQTFRVMTTPHLSTLPGKYKFILKLTFVESINDTEESIEIYDEEIEAILGMGYFLLDIILFIFGTSTILILSKKYEAEKKSYTSISTTPPPISSGVAGKIKCPECSKLIDEGLQFCPECGHRIPAFLQFGPSSGI